MKRPSVQPNECLGRWIDADNDDLKQTQLYDPEHTLTPIATKNLTVITRPTDTIFLKCDCEPIDLKKTPEIVNLHVYHSMYPIKQPRRSTYLRSLSYRVPACLDHSATLARKRVCSKTTDNPRTAQLG